MEMEAWFESITAPDTQRAAAKKSGIQQSKISRQLNAGKLDAEVVIALARAYNANIVQALVDTGYIRPEEVERIGIEEALDMATNQQMLDAIWRRTDKNPESRVLMGIKPGVVNPSPPAERKHLRSIGKNDVQDADYGDSMPLDAVAYDGPDEDKLREERGE